MQPVLPKYHIGLFFIFLICFLTRANAQLLTYETIAIEDGLPSNKIHCVIQDSKGYVWIGTKNGLCRWDSKNFEYFTIGEGLPNNEVLSLYEDASGKIWICCFSQELCYFFNGKIYNKKNTAFLNKIKIYSGSRVIEEGNQLYYSSVDGKLSKFNLLTQKITKYDSLWSLGFMFIKYKNKVWGIHEERERDRLVAKDAKTLVMSEDTSFYSSDRQLLVLPTNVYILTVIDFKNKCYYFQNGLDSPFYKSGYVNKDIQLCVYNEGKILEIYKNYIIQKKDNYTMQVDYTDRPRIFPIKKNIFMSTLEGLLFWRQIPVLEYEFNPKINNSANFLFKYKGDIYSVNDKYQLINVTKHKKVNQLKSNAINLYNLLNYENNFYISTSFDIYNFKDPNKTIEDSKSIEINNFKYISPSKKKDCFFTANGIGCSILLINFRAKTYDTLLYDLRKAVYSVFEDQQSRFWYTTANKTFYTKDYYSGVKNSKEFVLDTTKTLFCKAIQEDSKGNLFFTTNGGVFVFDGKKKYRIDNKNLLSDNECNKVVIDTVRSSFWVATKNGVNQIGYSGEKGSLKFKVLSKFFATDGLRSDNINDILLDSNKLYIATDKGVNILDDIEYRPDTMRIPIYIKLNAINATAIMDSSMQATRLGHDQNNLTIGFSALYFLRRDRLKIKAYLYRNNTLVSQSEITGDKIDYYSLNDGSYKLVLHAFDQDYRYINGRSAPFAFTITPPYYKTWWFIIGSSLLVIIISTSLLLWNLNRRKKRAIQQAELQAKLNESTLKSLQSQMNPHFVFNSLNTIQSFITEKNEEGAIDYLSDFSGLMREILEQSVHTFISLENEIQFLTHYIQLEIIRFKNSFDVVWDIDLKEDDLTDIYIPTMLIQPILENAVKHGVSSLNDTKGHIEVSFGLENDNLLRVVVRDNGKPATNKKIKGNSIAVQTIKDRLNIYTKNKVKGEYNLQVLETGAIATITIPI